MPFEDRCAIIKELSVVDKVIGFNDSDDSACQAIFHTLSTHGNIKVIFANGGDRTNTTTPEYATYGDMPNVEFAFGVGGTNKMNSSSWILDEWKTQKTERDWGYWRVLDHKPEQGYKVKELVIYPGKSLSDQKHFKRAEQWIVLEGSVDMISEWKSNVNRVLITPDRSPYEIGIEVWHKPSNPGKENDSCAF